MAIIGVCQPDPSLVAQHPGRAFYVHPAGDYLTGVNPVSTGSCVTTGIVDGGGLPDLATKVIGTCRPLSYVDDFYDRIHIIESKYALGSVTSNRSISFDVWNAWRKTTQTLTTISPSGDIGLDLLGDLAPPDVAFGPLTIRTYITTIDYVGPPNIQAAYYFSFSNGELPHVEITGTRLFLFPFINNWEDTLSETLEWKTDIIESENGTEQRVGLRELPRMFLEQSVLAYGDELRQLQAYIRGGYDRPYAIPLWTDQTRLLEDAPIGSTVLEVDTAERRFREGGSLAILHNSENFEVLNVSSIAGNSITLLSATTDHWSKNSPVFPVELATLQDSQPIKKLSSDLATAKISWEMDLAASFSPLTVSSGDEYNGLYVLRKLPNWSEDRDVTYAAKVFRLDNEVGRKYRDRVNEYDIGSQPFMWFLNGRADIEWFRSLLYYLDGRRVPFYFPTQSPDIRVIEDILSDDSGFYCYGNYMSQHFVPKTGEEIHIMLQLYTGETYYRQIADAYSIDSTKDWVELTNPDVVGDDTFGRLIKPNQIRSVSFLQRMRLEADRIQISWHHGTFAECKTKFAHVGAG